MTNEQVFTTIEHAAKYITSQTNADNGNDMFDAYHLLMEAWKAIGPMGEIPSWLTLCPQCRGNDAHCTLCNGIVAVTSIQASEYRKQMPEHI